MFLRKIFSSENKFTWVVIDLFIVIIGVYCAFLIQNYAADQKTNKEQDKILTALKYELEFFRTKMPGRAGYSMNQARQWKLIYDSGKYYNYASWRFVEPQYNYQVLEHAINIQDSDIIDFDLYQALQKLYVQIKRIEYSERLLTETALKYQSIPSSLSKGTIDYDLIWAANYENFGRFVQFMIDRSGNQERLGSESIGALSTINERLSPARKKEIETDLILSNLDNVKNEEQAVVMVSQIFPHFTEAEIRQLYRQANGLEQKTPVDTADTK